MGCQYWVLGLALAALACAGDRPTAVTTAGPTPLESDRYGADQDGVACGIVRAIPVSIASGQPPRYTVSGELCARRNDLVAGETVQLLVHGATYNHDYWDFGLVDGIRYSYARDVAAHGIPTFALDLLGAGTSSHPASDSVTVPVEADVVHQVVQDLRAGSIGGVRFGQVITVGHSLGSTVVWQEAAKYADVDGVIVTGAAHARSAKFVSLVPTTFYPAAQDDRFQGAGLDDGYLTTRPRTRPDAFFNLRDVDPAVVSQDDARKDVVPEAELATGVSMAQSRATLAIHVPVLTILGDHDASTCGLTDQGTTFDCSSGDAVAHEEAPFYATDARIHACIVRQSGHDVSLHFNRQQVFDAVLWSRAFVGQRDHHHISHHLPRDCGGLEGR